jgi:hypothetical protein
LFLACGWVCIYLNDEYSSCRVVLLSHIDFRFQHQIIKQFQPPNPLTDTNISGWGSLAGGQQTLL